MVHSAASGREALELARQQAFTVVVCDIRMPDLDGIEAVRLLRQELEDSRFIMITGYASEEAPIQALRLGVDDYLWRNREDALVLPHCAWVTMSSSMISGRAEDRLIGSCGGGIISSDPNTYASLS